MGELKILGAQRVKALQKILEDKEREALDTLPKANAKEISDLADEQLIGKEEIEQYNKLKEEIKPLEKKVNSIRYGNEWHKVRAGLQAPFDEKRKEIKKSFAEKKNSLWLCETMEEAKEIVGI